MSRRAPRFADVALLIGTIGGCSSEGTTAIEISGKPAGEAGGIIAQHFCGWQARCGRATVLCQASGSGGAGGGGMDSRSCVGEIRPVSFQECYADASADLTEILACSMPTAEEQDLIEGCFAGWIAQPCVTQAELAEAARTSEAGGTPPDLSRQPAACAAIERDVFGTCLPPPR